MFLPAGPLGLPLLLLGPSNLSLWDLCGITAASPPCNAHTERDTTALGILSLYACRNMPNEAATEREILHAVKGATHGELVSEANDDETDSQQRPGSTRPAQEWRMHPASYSGGKCPRRARGSNPVCRQETQPTACLACLPLAVMRGPSGTVRRIDVKIYPRSMVPCAALYFTGSDFFNRHMRYFCDVHPRYARALSACTYTPTRWVCTCDCLHPRVPRAPTLPPLVMHTRRADVPGSALPGDSVSSATSFLCSMKNLALSKDDRADQIHLSDKGFWAGRKKPKAERKRSRQSGSR